MGALLAWTDISQQLSRSFRLPIATVDVVGAVDRVFDVAEQGLAVHREVARTLVGVVTRQADAAVDAAVETVTETADRVQGELEAVKAEAPKAEAPKPEPAKEQHPTEELRERARELDIEGRSSMSKDELIAALRKHSR